MRKRLARRVALAVVAAAIAVPLLLTGSTTAAAPNGCTAKSSKQNQYSTCNFYAGSSTVNFTLVVQNSGVASIEEFDPACQNLVQQVNDYGGRYSGSWTDVTPGDCIVLQASGTNTRATAKDG